jgi:hypothetical protein
LSLGGRQRGFGTRKDRFDRRTIIGCDGDADARRSADKIHTFNVAGRERSEKHVRICAGAHGYLIFRTCIGEIDGKDVAPGASDDIALPRTQLERTADFDEDRVADHMTVERIDLAKAVDVD